MSFAIKPGTTEWQHIDEGKTPDGWIRVEEEPPRVLFDITPAGVVVKQGVLWDEKLQAIRVKTSKELVADQQASEAAQKRTLVKALVVDAVVDSILAGKVPSDPVMADVAAKVAAADAVVVVDSGKVRKP